MPRRGLSSRMPSIKRFFARASGSSLSGCVCKTVLYGSTIAVAICGPVHVQAFQNQALEPRFGTSTTGIVSRRHAVDEQTLQTPVTRRVPLPQKIRTEEMVRTRKEVSCGKPPGATNNQGTRAEHKKSPMHILDLSQGRRRESCWLR